MIKTKIESYQHLKNAAYDLFEGKYTIQQIATMPYRDLLEELDAEQKYQQEMAQARAARQKKNRDPFSLEGFSFGKSKGMRK